MDRPDVSAQNTAMQTMRAQILTGLAFAAALAASSAQGQSLGRAKAEGDALLLQADAVALFDNITADDAADIKLKHKASGLVCAFNPGQASNRIVLFDGAKGEDFACTTSGEAGDRTLYAAHTPGRTLEDAFGHDVAEVKKSHPGALPYALPPGTDSPILQMLTIPPMPPSRTARFIADHRFTSVSSAVVKGWSLEFRFTCPEDRQDAAAGTVEPTLWVTILAQMSGAPLDLIGPKTAV